LWIEALNAQPIPFATSAIAANVKPPEGLADDDPRDKQSEKSIRLSILQKYRFDLRGAMGSVLRERRKFDLDSLSGIRVAYIATFGESAKGLFDGEDFETVQLLEAVRNLFVHRGGIIDKRFLARVKHSKDFEGLLENTPIEVDGETTVKYANASARMGIALLNFVDEQLSSRSEK
jgi:hypothetical protein